MSNLPVSNGGVTMVASANTIPSVGGSGSAQWGGPPWSQGASSFLQASEIANGHKSLIVRGIIGLSTYIFFVDGIQFRLVTRPDGSGGITLTLSMDDGRSVSSTASSYDVENTPLARIVEQHLPRMMTEMVVFLKLEQMP